MRGLAAFLIILCLCGTAYAEIDLHTIASIESSHNPNAFNRHSKARGLYQITPICLRDYNQFHPTKYTTKDLFNPAVNEQIAKWYLQSRIPRLLAHYGAKPTTRNILVSYNAGINYVVKGLPLPSETVQYIRKYERRIYGSSL